MSTVGKVFCILIAVPTLVWIWLASGVAEMNRNWGKQIRSYHQQIAQADESLTATIEQIAKSKAEIDLVQREKDDHLLAQRALLSKLFKAESFSKETQERYGLQRSSVELSLEGAQRRQQQAEQILADTNKALADSKADLVKTKAEHARQLAQLEAIRDEFAKTHEENLNLVESALRAQQAKSPSTGGASTLAR